MRMRSQNEVVEMELERGVVLGLSTLPTPWRLRYNSLRSVRAFFI